jgi:hypothetical protein
VLIFKLFLNRHNGGDIIQKFLLFIEDNNEREVFGGKPTESEWIGKFIIVPHDKESREKKANNKKKRQCQF